VIERLTLPDSITGRLFASIDWTATPLGPVGAWSKSLRTAVGIALSSRFPMFVWWGAELIYIYNDAHIPILGLRHPAAFGRPARETWAEIWDVVGPQADAVMQRGEATWNERVPLLMQRHGYSEETWFTFSYSPIPDDEGGIGGVFCATMEDTEHVLVERERDRLHQEVDFERQRLLDVFRQSPAFIAVLRGPTHVFEFGNERYRHLVGGRDFVGKTVEEALPEIAGQGFVELLDRVYATGEPYVGTGTQVVLEGLTLHLDFVYQPMRDLDGKVTAILVHGIEVTEQKHAEGRRRFLLELEDTLRPLNDPASITSAGARLLGEYLRADRCAYADVEADQDTFNLIGDYNNGVPSIVGRYTFTNFGAEVLRLMRADLPYVVADVDTHRPPIGDLSYYRQTRIQSVICVPLHKSGRFVAAMAVHQSKPRQWRAEEIELVRTVASRCYESIERARVERTLRESEAAFRQLADAMPQIVFAATPDGHVDYFNRQWYAYTGLPEGTAGYESWQRVHQPEFLERTVRRWDEAVRSGQPYEVEYPLRRRDGEYRWHLGRALPIRDARGRIVRWLGTNTDIHEQKEFERSLQAARAEAERASRMKDEFLATLSHELRTPLNAILGWSEVLRLKAELPADLMRGVDAINRNARAQGTIINDLLDMSAIISGKVHLEMARLDLAELVRAAVETARPAAAAKNVALEARIEIASGFPLSGDAARLQQVLWNLLSNAVKFTAAGGRVDIDLRRAGREFELRVSDTGEGIEADFLPHLFDRFRQADASKTRRHGGLGLGLSIVKQLVALHGGAVRAESPGKGQGATFTVLLPALRTPRAPQAAPVEAGGPAAPTAAGELAGLNVLVVDDDRDARQLVKRLLEDCRASVTTAASGSEATDLLQQSRFDVLVSDIGMPDEDGHALLRRIRALGPGHGGDIPAVALTAYARPEDRDDALRAGFESHLAKPVEPSQLIAVVASAARRA
jgi:PAS domain S-box-containing protein